MGKRKNRRHYGAYCGYCHQRVERGGVRRKGLSGDVVFHDGHAPDQRNKANHERYRNQPSVSKTLDMMRYL